MSAGESTAEKEDLGSALSRLLELASNGKLMLKPGYAVIGLAGRAVLGKSLNYIQDVHSLEIGSGNHDLKMIDLHFRDIGAFDIIVHVRLARIRPFSLACGEGTLWDMLNDVTLKLIDGCKKDSKVLYPCPTDLSEMALRLFDEKLNILSHSSLLLT
ncbi:hypothetical protein, partial [Acidilobus sp.]|uniref:hypothetical protein n=1 Tax=Acidilobus sp. TaxID=1872109 RepID=UPI003CFFC597